MFGGNFAPVNWAFCDGSVLPISENEALFSLIGTTYGGDGQTTFQLPDLRGRLAVGTGAGSGLTPRTLGEVGGSTTVTLTPDNVPAHTHTAQAVQTPGTSTSPAGTIWAADSGGSSYASAGPTPAVPMA